MVNWICPKCNGGFARFAETEKGASCPWCGERMAKQPKQFENTVARSVVKDNRDDERESGVLRGMFT